MKSLLKSSILGFGLILAAQVTASATTYLYSYSGPDGSFSFTDSNAPIPFESVGGLLTTLDVDGIYNGEPAHFDVAFTSESALGGFNAGSGSVRGLFLETGPQLYTGSESAPMFAIQSTSLQNVFGNGTFTISAPATTISAVPEPSTWAMFLLGFSGLGFLGYCKSRKGDAAAMLAV